MIIIAEADCSTPAILLYVSVWDCHSLIILFAAVDTFITHAIGESVVIIPDADACFTFWTVFMFA